jgi:hypothetical protein
MNANRRKTPDDMPLTGLLVRERKGMYVCLITFATSRRLYVDEIVYAGTVKEAKAYIARRFPTIKWRKKR